ncbi:MAG: ABC transporter ATP-binding protein [Clostridia bacterium]|nr:ABC transporter ATP-binding protein [Clostridia bacterium]
MGKVLDVKGLTTTFTIGKKDYEVIHNLSFHIDKNETLCIVGESGCGKSVTTLCLMDLLPENGQVTGGEMVLDGKNLGLMTAKERRLSRGSKMGMIFQEPMTALNPLLTVGFQIIENIRQHDRKISKSEAKRLAVEALRKVDIPEPESRMKQYPFQLSGGLRQRVMIAMTLAAKPILLIADEPTTALDVTIQKQVLKLMNTLKSEMDAGILFITHDLGVVGEIADRVVVLYSGDKVEEAKTEEIFRRPLHPYTQGLFKAYPQIDAEDFELKPIEGSIPLLTEPVSGCRFHPRCPYATEKCARLQPKQVEPYEGHFVACFKVEEEFGL